MACFLSALNLVFFVIVSVYSSFKERCSCFPQKDSHICLEFQKSQVFAIFILK